MSVLPFPLSEKVTPDTLKQKCNKALLLENESNATYLKINVKQPNSISVEKIVHPKSNEQYPELKIRERDHFDMTMLSDQGFEMSNAKYSFFSFWSYLLQPKGFIKSQCDRTQVGWFTDAEKKVFGCFIAYKKVVEKGDVIVHRPISDMIKREDNLHITDDDDEDDVDSDLLRIKEINTSQNSWTAARTHITNRMKLNSNLFGSPIRAHSPQELKKELRRLQAKPLNTNEDDDDDTKYRAADGSETFISKKKATVKALPAKFDWRNVNGESFISPVRDQGACGSCYAMATIDALEARVRIQTKNQHKLDLAVQDVISCSPYSQQCNGGYPFGVARYVSDFGIVTEECMAYKAENGTCSSKCADPKIVVRAESYNYIGGYLGAGNEEDMKLEIFNNGPIVASFFVHDDFKYYKNGIYSHVEGKAGKKGKVNPIEVTSHSVCIIGWDVDEITGEKSWIVKNSWGKLFGEEAPKDSAFYKTHCTGEGYCGGFFRIRRSVDESAVESAAVSFIPKLILN